MTLLAEQQRVLAVHANLAKSLSPDGRTHISLVESNGRNITWITQEFTRLVGWGNGSPWCAMTVSVAAYYAKVLEVKDFSASAWGLMDHLRALGLGISQPEVAAQVSYSEGAGHTGTLLRNVGGSTWMVGEGNWGDRYQVVTRDLNRVPGGIYGYARLPGVAAAMNKPLVAKGQRPLPGGILQQGDKGQRVADLQLWLNRKNLAENKVDGDFGPATKTVLVHVQHGLKQKEDGKLTPALRNVLVSKYGA